ncbi:MAG: AtpZ/AtpI family protein [Candidatus Schekmanbacteria bacterium]|nr:AtpZ/AtpI family protein [Candidatus Schekmanbacteria bacterium]
MNGGTGSSWGQIAKEVANLAAVGIHLVVCTVIGVAIGYYLDQWLGSAPIFLLLFMLLGVVAGFRNVWRLTSRARK